MGGMDDSPEPRADLLVSGRILASQPPTLGLVVSREVDALRAGRRRVRLAVFRRDTSIGCFGADGGR